MKERTLKEVLRTMKVDTYAKFIIIENMTPKGTMTAYRKDGKNWVLIGQENYCDIEEDLTFKDIPNNFTDYTIEEYIENYLKNER